MKDRAPRNRTVFVSDEEKPLLTSRLVEVTGPLPMIDIENRTVHGDLLEILEWLPERFVDLLILDPPYNLSRTFGETNFRQQSMHDYHRWFESWFPNLLRCLRPKASIYICGDWRSSAAIHLVAGEYLNVRNRITWEREKGRGAKANWKNCSEDIWFCTVGNEYTFNVEAVKLKRRIVAPYTLNGEPKDWTREDDGNYRLTYPSNLWTDLSVPFWSMPENTDHPTQKPEKLIAKLILASSNPGDIVLDPFVGSGTTSSVARKLGRRFVGIEKELEYCLLTEKRLLLAESGTSIQGFADGVFWERNSLRDQKSTASQGTKLNNQLTL